MYDINREEINENWYALAISIICEVTPEKAFTCLKKGRYVKRNVWTQEKKEKIKELREQKVRWKDIAAMYGIDDWKNFATLYNSWRKRGKI